MLSETGRNEFAINRLDVVTAVPEPSAFVMFSAALLAAGALCPHDVGGTPAAGPYCSPEVTVRRLQGPSPAARGQAAALIASSSAQVRAVLYAAANELGCTPETPHGRRPVQSRLARSA